MRCWPTAVAKTKSLQRIGVLPCAFDVLEWNKSYEKCAWFCLPEFSWTLWDPQSWELKCSPFSFFLLIRVVFGVIGLHLRQVKGLGQAFRFYAEARDWIMCSVKTVTVGLQADFSSQSRCPVGADSCSKTLGLITLFTSATLTLFFSIYDICNYVWLPRFSQPYYGVQVEFQGGLVWLCWEFGVS